MSQVLVNIESGIAEDDGNIYSTEVQIGHYSNYEVYPTCGLSTTQSIVGVVDDPRYFAHPDRINAGILWFTRGYIEYIIPNLLPIATKIDQITLSMEISSEAPGVNSDWPSDISFFLNDVKLGVWTSPGDYGDVQGIFTPDWWFPNWNQYGLLKMLIINKRGTFIDGLKISDVTIDQLQLDYKSTVRFKVQVADDAVNCGGLTIFGKNFGNYNQDIKVRIAYSPM
jgi:predicted transcriptional regulator